MNTQINNNNSLDLTVDHNNLPKKTLFENSAEDYNNWPNNLTNNNNSGICNN